MKTYRQWFNDAKANRIAKGKKFSDVTHTVDRWWAREIEPRLELGEKLPLAVCRSIVTNGGGMSLTQINKFYPNAVPIGVSYKTGLLRD